MANQSHSSPHGEEFVLPPIWDDDDAMYSLMQPIRRPKRVDPEAYSKKVRFWIDLLLAYAKHQRVTVISIESLQTVFARYFIEEGMHLSPQCLPEVFSSLLESGKLEPITDRSGLLRTVLKTGFDYLIKAPLDWTFRLAFGETHASEASVSAKVSPEQHFALTDLSEQLTRQFITHFAQHYETRRLTLRLPVYELGDFETALAEFFPHDATREYIRQLCTDTFRCVRYESVTDSGGNWNTQVVRVSDGVHSPLSPNAPKKADAQTELSMLGGLAHIRAVIRQLEAEEQKLTSEIDARRERVKALLKLNRLREAKSLLVRTKVLEKSLAARQTHLHHLEAMQLQIDSASDNKTVLNALADSGRALQQVTGGPEGLSKIEDTMHDIADTVQDSHEVSDLISSFGQTSFQTDEDELEKELQALIAPEPVTPKRPPASKTASQLSEGQLEAELANLCLDQLNLPETPTAPIRPSGLSKSEQPDN